MSIFKKNLDLLDPDTGEIIGQTPFLFKKKANLEGEFVMARQEGFLRLSKEKDLTGDDRRVLDVYFGNLDFDNYIQISQQTIADYLEMKKQNVSRSTKKLLEKGILVEGTKVGRHNTYRLNPFYGWKGKADKEFHDFYDKHAKQTQA
jgi:DNA-binding transcriptional ArsR family regulator